MRNIIIQRKLLVWFAAMMIAAVAGIYLMPSAGIAEDSGAEIGDAGHSSQGVFKKIQDPPEFEAGEVVKSGRLEEFFDATGTLNRIDDKAIIVGDYWFKIADGVRFTGISRGDRIGVRLNEEKEVVEFEKLKDVPH